MTTYTGTEYLNTAGTAVSGRVGRTEEKKVRKHRSIRKGFGVTMFALCVFCAMVFFLQVFFSCNLMAMQAENNRLQAENEYMQAEIDSMEDRIVEVTKVSSIEKTATQKYGMVYPSAQNCITIKADKPQDNSLASIIKHEAYN